MLFVAEERIRITGTIGHVGCCAQHCMYSFNPYTDSMKRYHNYAHFPRCGN